MHRIALCLVLSLALPAAAMAQQGTGNTRENIDKADKRANSGGKESQQHGGGVHGGKRTAPAATPGQNGTKTPQ